MIPQNFEYSAPDTLAGSAGAVADGSAKVLAGGMSLIPLMKLRLAAPEHVVDMRRVPDLNYIREEAGGIHIGATTTHYADRILAAAARALPAAGGNGSAHRRRAGAQHGHHRRQHGACRSGGRLSGGAAGARSQGAPGERATASARCPSPISSWTPLPRRSNRARSCTESSCRWKSSGTGSRIRRCCSPLPASPLVGVAARVARRTAASRFARVGITGLARKAYRATNVEKASCKLRGDVGQGGRGGRRWRGGQLRSVRLGRLSQPAGPRLHRARAAAGGPARTS